MSQDHKPNLKREIERVENRLPARWRSLPMEVNHKSFKSDEQTYDIPSMNEEKSETAVGVAPERNWEDSLTEIVIDVPIQFQHSFIGRRALGSILGPPALMGRYGVSLTMTRSVGDRTGPRSCISQPDVTAVTLAPQQHGRFVLASDGLWDVLTVEQAMMIALRAPDPLQASYRLAYMAYSKRIRTRMRLDDIAVVVVDVFPESFTGGRVDSQCSCTVT
eukprot:gene651-720_t